MNNKKLGAVFLVFSLVLSIIFVNLISDLNKESDEIGCFEDENCKEVQSSLSVTNFIFGIIGFILALGFYLIFFSRGEEEILKRLEENKRDTLKEKKFELILRALDPYEKKVLKSIKEQDGITQNTLRIRTDMSKAKLSYVINDLEKKGLIKRIQKGKTLAVFLKDIY